MTGSKEMYLDLQQKEWLIRIGNEAFEGLSRNYPAIIRDAVVSYKDEHKILMETNSDYKETYKTYREAKKILDEHKKNLREKSRRNS